MTIVEAKEKMKAACALPRGKNSKCPIAFQRLRAIREAENEIENIRKQIKNNWTFLVREMGGGGEGPDGFFSFVNWWLTDNQIKLSEWAEYLAHDDIGSQLLGESLRLESRRQWLKIPENAPFRNTLPKIPYTVEKGVRGFARVSQVCSRDVDYYEIDPLNIVEGII